MRQERWRAILDARDDIDKLVAAAVGPQVVLVRAASLAPRAVKVQETTRMLREPMGLALAPVADVEHETLHRLHQGVLARIEVLRRAALTAEPDGEEAMVALVLYFDERIMGQLPELLATSWPLLQTPFTRRKTGGSDFFRLIDRRLDGAPPPGFVLEVYYFCLGSGFQGQYADDPAALEGYKQRLRRHIAAPEPVPPPRELAAAASPAPIRSPALYYLAAAMVVVVVAIALTVWSN
jgi:type IV/VI secretion system ImpK/VasF family protein